MDTVLLNGIWDLRGNSELSKSKKEYSLKAQVPGCVQLDLCENGYLPKDIYMGENITKAEELEDYEWWYSRTFDAPDIRENVYLVFEGVDCIAEYFLNGEKIGESDNMFISHEFLIDNYIRDGINEITVHLKSVILEADRKDYNLKTIHNLSNVESRYIRKAPHSYGWDIMPRMVTAGLWRDVRIEIRDRIYFSQTFFKFHEEKYMFYYVLESTEHRYDDIEIEISASCGRDSCFNHRFSAVGKGGKTFFVIDNMKKWFPYGYGEPNVYEGIAKIYHKGELVHEEVISFGIRDVILDRRDVCGDDDGQFRFLINGEEIFCKGTNWVCLDAFHSRDKERYDEALSLLKDAGCNIVRCWGGNVYEDHKFYDFCDRNGIMVWQDFSMACAAYPECDEFKESIRKEAESVVRKLRNHPSIILWSGDNEVDCSVWGFNPDDNTITREVLPKVIELNDISRPYLPSSPYITGEMYKMGIKSQVTGSRLVEDHMWGPRNYYKSEFYKTNSAKFISETGYHGCPSFESIKKFISREKLWPYKDNSQWILHSSDRKGNDSRVMLMEKQVRNLFGNVPEEPEEYILASQISQAEAKKYFIERMRVRRPDKTGIIWWNLLDGWPQMSDAVVDYYFTKKLAYSYIKRCQAPFCVCADEIKDGVLSIYACNDTLVSRRGKLKVKDALNEDIIIESDFAAEVNSSSLIAELPLDNSGQRVFIFEWEQNGEKGFNHYLVAEPPVCFEMYKEFLKKYN